MKTIVKFGVACIFGGVCVLTNSMSAYALDFNFSFVGDQGSNPGIETGIIQGLTDNNTASVPTDVIITSNTVGIPSGYILGYYSGSFSVANGTLIGANNYFGADLNYALYLNYNGLNRLEKDNNNASSYNNNGFSGVTYSPVTSVPWEWNPVEGSVLGVPLFIGLRFLKKSKLQKSTMNKVAETIS